MVFIPFYIERENHCMKRKKTNIPPVIRWGIFAAIATFGLTNPMNPSTVEATKTGPSHIGTFEGSTTFMTSSRNGINPGLFIEVMDENGNLTQYESEEGVITIPNTKEGAYVTQAKLLGKTKYVDEDTGEVLDQWESGRNLRLASVEGATLKTTGDNLWNDNWSKGLTQTNGSVLTGGTYDGFRYNDDLIPVDGLRTIYLKHFCPQKETGQYFRVGQYDENKEWLNRPLTMVYDGTFNVPKDCKYIRVHVDLRYDGASKNTDDTVPTMLVVSPRGLSEIKNYEPYQSNIITVNEEVELRGIGDVQDTLDLMTGEVTQHVGEIVLDGSENWMLTSNENDTTIRFALSLPNSIPATILCDTFKVEHTYEKEYECIQLTDNKTLVLRISKNKATNLDELKSCLNSNPFTIQFLLSQNTVKTVDLNSTYTFPPVTTQHINVNGNVSQTIASVNVPGDSLSFVLNPNESDEQQFIAPTLTLVNESLAPISVEVKTFEQVTNLFNDVLPEAYENWDGLNQTQSRDFALALEPIPSEGWVSLNEGPSYVANTINKKLGTIKGKRSVDFTFSALHGRAFAERLVPQYRLTFVFDFQQSFI